MTPPPSQQPPPDGPPGLHDVDERWTVPWGVLDDGTDGPGSAPLVWHGAATPLRVHGYTLVKPMLYTSEGPAADRETSCIDTSLPVGPPDPGAGPAGHWAGYAGLTPAQRANYLAWLASGCTAPLDDVNLAFLYFYGLERHALIDKGEPEDILRVLMGLLKHYDSAPAFFSNASRLAAFLFATKGIERLKPAWFKRLFLQRAMPLHGDALAVAATWLFERGKPLPPELALEIARKDIRCPHGDIYARDPEAFGRRFREAYVDRFGDGLMLEAAEKPQTWKYRPINPSLQSWQHFASLWAVTSADVMGAYSQFAPLVELWRECEPGDGAAAHWTGLIDAHASADGRVLVPVGKLAGHLGLKRPRAKSFSLEESLSMAASAREAGFELLPNPFILLRPFKVRERVVLARSAPRHGESEPYYLAGTLLLALGTAIAEADGTVDHVEVLHVSEIVNSLYHFNDHDKQRLGVLRRRLIKFPPNLNSLIRRVRAILTEEECPAVGKFLVGVAGANYRIEAEEARALRRAYRAFGIPVAQLDALLAELVEGDAAGGGESIRRDVLGRYMRETKAFAVALGHAMEEVQPAGGPDAGKRGIWYIRKQGAAKGAPTSPARKADPYCDALYALLQRPGWTDAEFVALGEEHGIYVAGAIAALEDWTADIADEAGTARYVFAADGESAD